MNQKRTKSVIIAALLLISMLLWGCGGNGGNSKPDPEPLVNPISVTVSVEFPEGAEKENLSDTIEVEDGSTVTEALYAFATSEDIVVTVQDGASPYVDSIDQISEKDFGASAGWVFELNGEMVMEGPSLKTLSEGDSVVWKYADYSDTSQ